MDPTGDGLSERTRRDVETFLDDWRVEKDVPGASVAVVDGDDRLFATGMGARDVEARAPAPPDTRYPFASVTRVVTGVVVLQLVERGDLALDFRDTEEGMELRFSSHRLHRTERRG